MKNRSKAGQSIIELVFAVGIVSVVITGVVILLVNIISSKNKGFDRKKAAEFSQIIMEDLITQKRSEPDNFWKLGRYNPRWSSSDFNNYTYSVGFTNIIDNDNGCGIGITDCANAVVEIGWSGGTGGQNQSSVFQRFFSRRSD